MGFEYDKIKDPAYFMENRLAAHSNHKRFRTHEEIIDEESSFIHLLNGIWKFHYANNYITAPQHFWQENYNCDTWDDISVPGHIQLQGYDIPQYLCSQYTWDGKEEVEPGEIPTDFNPVGSYVTYFTVPKHMKNEKICISFQGVETGFALWLNGHYIGYASDSFTPSEFDLTPYIKKDAENKLAVQVFKYTAGSWLECQDFYRMSGIFRDVYLYSVPKTSVVDLKVDANLDKDFTTAHLKIQLGTIGEGSAQVKLSFLGTTIATQTFPDFQNIELSIDDPYLWSAEFPHLYQLTIEIYDKNDTLQEIIVQHIGFRRFEMLNQLMCINGQPIAINGVNRHEFSPHTGRAGISREMMEMDILLMKRNNINTLRASHYPNHAYLYELCDKYGIYVIDEVNLETHGQWDKIRFYSDGSHALPGDNPQWLPACIDRLESMYQRTKNYASIIIWSLGNESWGGKMMLEMANHIRKLDSSRLVHYEGVHWDPRYPETSDMYTQMYTKIADLEQFLIDHQDKPTILCEYAPVVGNSVGAIHKYMELMDKYPHYQGGLIWDWVDQSLVKKDRYGKEFNSYGGDFGDRPTDYNFCANGLLFGDRSEKPEMQTVKYNFSPVHIIFNSEQEITIKNKHLFTNVADFNCVITLEKNGKFVRSWPLEVNVAPLSKETYLLPVEMPKVPGVYVLTVALTLKEDATWGKRGHEIAFGQFVKEVTAEKKACTEAIKVVKNGMNIGVHGRHFSAIFRRDVSSSKFLMGLQSYKYAGREMVELTPRPNFWRAPIENDTGANLPAIYSQWKLASLYATHVDMVNRTSNLAKVTEYEHAVEIAYTYFLPTNPINICKVIYTVYGDGTIKTDLSCTPVGMPAMPEFGMIFKINADYQHLTWFGLGPAETYMDKKTGAKLGIYQNKVQDNLKVDLIPQENGNKVDVRWAKITDNSGRGIVFNAEDVSFEFSALPYTPHEIENAMHHFELPPVHYTVIRINKQQMGVGGEQCWGATPLEEYLLPVNTPLNFSFSFKGI